MESAISSLILFTAFLFAVLTFAHNDLVTQDVLALSEQQMEIRRMEQARTGLGAVAAATSGEGQFVDVTLRNTGDVMLADYHRWDVIVEYYYHPSGSSDPDERALAVNRLSYSTTAPADGQWAMQGIYANAASLTPEVFDLGIVNPGEEIVLQMRVSPSVAMTTTNRVTVGVANGATVSAFFTR